MPVWCSVLGQDLERCSTRLPEKPNASGESWGCTQIPARKSIPRKLATIIALIGMKNVNTGHTLCDQKRPATLEPMVFPVIGDPQSASRDH